MKSLSRDEVRRIDRLAIDKLGVSGLVLMENAGRNAADVIERFLVGSLPIAPEKSGLPAAVGSARPSMRSRRVAVVAGAGNNGGDGFVIARHLAMRGAEVVTFLVVPAGKIAGDALANLAILRNLGHDIRQLDAASVACLASQLAGFDAVVDAVGGTGIQGALRGEAAIAVEQINAAGRPVIAVDIPTGLDCDTGDAPGPTIRAAVTVTFVARKLGFDAPCSRQYTGHVVVADIGIPADSEALES